MQTHGGDGGCQGRARGRAGWGGRGGQAGDRGGGHVGEAGDWQGLGVDDLQYLQKFRKLPSCQFCLGKIEISIICPFQFNLNGIDSS